MEVEFTPDGTEHRDALSREVFSREDSWVSQKFIPTAYSTVTHLSGQGTLLLVPKDIRHRLKNNANAGIICIVERR